MYDFDGTLSPGNMQEYGFLDKLGESSTEFWRKSNEEARKFEMDPISAYMHLMIKETESRALNISKENLIELGQTVDLFPGVETWFKRINEYAHAKGLKVEHFIIPPHGLKEIINRAHRSLKNSEKFLPRRFIFDAYGKPVWPAQIVNFTTKTQYNFPHQQRLFGSSGRQEGKINIYLKMNGAYLSEEWSISEMATRMFPA